MKKNASFPIIALLLLLCLTAPLSSAYAEIQGVATVIALRGAAVAQDKGGGTRNLSLKSQIFQEDVLKTDKTGQLQIMFTDNSIISLGRDSEMKIAEYRWQPDQKDGALKTQVKEGVFRVMGGTIAKESPQNFKTQTPTATIGIRGSMYAFKSTTDSLSVVFQGGKGIEVFNNLGKVTITVPGFGTRVVLNSAPARPSKFTEQDIKNLNKGLNGAAGSGNGTTDGSTNDTSAANGSSGGGATGSTTDTTTPPLAETILPPLTVPEIPVLPPTNELPTAPNFTLPPTPPTDGIFAFEGTITGISKNPTTGETIDTFTNGMKLGVNWHNRRIFGIAYDNTVQNGTPAFFFGSVNGATVSDITIFGSDKGGPNNAIGAIEGYGAGTFAGSAFDFFAFSASGASYLVKDLNITQAAVDAWTAGGGGQQVPGAMVPVAPTGSETWKGFVVGVSENMADPSLNRHLLYNTDPNNFSLAIDKDAGTINGAMTTNTNIGAAYQITGMTVGGAAYGSVYLKNNMLAALLGGSSGITEKTYGNYMVATKEGDQFSTYFTWGYWEVAYNDPANSTIARHIHVPYSMWLAGKPTDLQPLSTYSGTYTGGVRGTQINGTVATELRGTVSIPVNFSNNSIGAGGSIAIDNGPTLNIAGTGTGAIVFPGGGAVNSFSTLITGAYTSEVHGIFYGSKAEAVGGNFHAEMTLGGIRYLGIFGGNR